MYDSMGELTSLAICLFYSLMCVFIVHPLVGCGGGQRPQAENPSKPGQQVPLYISKTCNKKAGLCNDDPDLKSDKLMMTGGADKGPSAEKPQTEDKSKAASGNKSTDLRSAAGPGQAIPNA